MPATDIDVKTLAEDARLYRLAVRVREGGGETSHEVTLSRDLLARLAPAEPADACVRWCFAFLLEREPKESIPRGSTSRSSDGTSPSSRRRSRDADWRASGTWPSAWRRETPGSARRNRGRDRAADPAVRGLVPPGHGRQEEGGRYVAAAQARELPRGTS